jgi:hypothetical protein
MSARFYGCASPGAAGAAVAGGGAGVVPGVAGEVVAEPLNEGHPVDTVP